MFRNVAHVAVAIHVYFKCILQMFHLIPNVCLQVFHLNVAYVFTDIKCFQVFFFKCFICMFRVFQLCRCSKPSTSKFVSARLARMMSAEDTRNYTDSGRTSLRPVRCCSRYRLGVCSKGYKQTREERGLKSLVSVLNGVVLLSNGLRALERLQSLLPLMGHPTLPFIVQGKG
jgi:hypothetical protein